MTKFYEVNVARCDCEGNFDRFERIAFTTTREIAERIAKDFRAEHQVGQYWCEYYTIGDGLFIKAGDEILIEINEFEAIDK